MLTELCVWKLSIEILVKWKHKLENLVLRDGEAHAFEHVMELVHFNITVFVFINLVETVLQSESSLQQYFHQMIKDLVLGVLHLTLFANIC